MTKEEEKLSELLNNVLLGNMYKSNRNENIEKKPTTIKLKLKSKKVKGGKSNILYK